MTLKYKKLIKTKFDSHFKYVSDDSYVLKSIFIDKNIRFTQPAALNDPLEFNPVLHFRDNKKYTRYIFQGVEVLSFHDIQHLNLIEKLYNKYGVLSLTKNPFDHRMWNQYANGHKGILIELEPDFLSNSCFHYQNKKPEIIKVKYVKDYKINMDKYIIGDSDIKVDEFVKLITSLKTTHWKYENEYRVIRKLNECSSYISTNSDSTNIYEKYLFDKNVYLFDFDFDCIEGIYFGANCSSNTKKMIINACKNFDIKFFQEILYKENGVKIGYSPINKLGTEEYLNLLPRIFTYTDSLNRIKRVEIDRISDIPYYQTFSDLIDDYIKNIEKYKPNNWLLLY